jgi:hypothetical protein
VQYHEVSGIARAEEPVPVNDLRKEEWASLIEYTALKAPYQVYMGLAL